MNYSFNRVFIFLLFLVLPGFLASCKVSEEDNPDEETTATENACLANEDFFHQKVWEPILTSRCFGCHNPDGKAIKDGARYVLQFNSVSDYTSSEQMAQEKAGNGQSLWVLKPIGEVSHGGGQIITPNSTQHQNLAEMAQRFSQTSNCSDRSYPDALKQVIYASPEETLRKASLNLAGRLPTQLEKNLVSSGGEDGLKNALNSIMTEDGFYDRLKEIFNDHLLTDKYIAFSTAAIGLLSSADYPDLGWYNDASNDNSTRRNTLREHANWGIAKAPLELIAHVVRQNRPFTEILTADYQLVNGYSARSLGVVSDRTFQDTDATADHSKYDFFEAKITSAYNGGKAIPHSGVLTSPMIWNRYPTTSTNRNRHRIRYLFNIFLDTDILEMGQRQIDPPEGEESNPTMTNTQCISCHAVMDPAAGLLKNWNSRGRYRPFDWYSDVRSPGYNENDPLPASELDTGARWLGQKMGEDPRFHKAIVKILFEGITGQEILSPPQTYDSKFYDYTEAYEAQQAILNNVEFTFYRNNYSAKEAIKDIITGPYFRAKGSHDTTGERDDLLKKVGMGRMLTPEQLDRKIEALIGFPWERWGAHNLLSSSRYRILYGGIDSDSVNSRVVEPNGLMAAVQLRMANEMSCLSVPYDFSIPNDSTTDSRILFPHVSKDQSPYSPAGSPIPGDISAIKQNIQHLYQHLLDERISTEGEEAEATFSLFLDTWCEGNDEVKICVDRGIVQPSTYNSYLPWECRARNYYGTNTSLPSERRIEQDSSYVIRAWMAVTTYLLTDYQFLYE